MQNGRAMEVPWESLAASAVGGGSNTLAGADLDIGLRVARCRGAHPLLDLPGHGQEGLFDIAGVLGGGLEEWDSEAVGEFLMRLLAACPSFLKAYPLRQQMTWPSRTPHRTLGTKAQRSRQTKDQHHSEGRRGACIRTLATVYSTTFLSAISLLLPTSNLLTPSVA